MQEDLPDVLLSNHDAFFVKLNISPPLLANAASVVTSTAAAASITSPKLGSKKAPMKAIAAGSPLCSPPSTPRLKAAANIPAVATAAPAAVADGAAVADLTLESGQGEAAAVSEDAVDVPVAMQYDQPETHSPLLLRPKIDNVE